MSKTIYEAHGTCRAQRHAPASSPYRSRAVTMTKPVRVDQMRRHGSQWTDWKPFPDPEKGGFITAPFGSGCYELRRADSGELVLVRVSRARRLPHVLAAPIRRRCQEQRRETRLRRGPSLADRVSGHRTRQPGGGQGFRAARAVVPTRPIRLQDLISSRQSLLGPAREKNRGAFFRRWADGGHAGVVIVTATSRDRTGWLG